MEYEETFPRVIDNSRIGFVTPSPLGSTEREYLEHLGLNRTLLDEKKKIQQAVAGATALRQALKAGLQLDAPCIPFN